MYMQCYPLQYGFVEQLKRRFHSAKATEYYKQALWASLKELWARHQDANQTNSSIIVPILISEQANYCF